MNELVNERMNEGGHVSTQFKIFMLTGMFRCLNGFVVKMSQQCDGEDDCGDFTDEIECGT